MVMASCVGVRTAEAIAIIKMAYLLCFLIVSVVKSPSQARKPKIIGSSKTTPNINISLVVIEKYSLMVRIALS